MEIECKNCHYKYNFKVYGEKCPKCYFENKPFRAESARRLMGYEDDSLRGKYFDNHRAERREELLRSGDPDYGKSFFRRFRKYALMLAMCFGILLLGKTLLTLSYLTNTPPAPIEKPPVSQLASTIVGTDFRKVQGVSMRVQYVGIVPDEKLGAQKGKKLCVFVDVRATVKKYGLNTFPGKIFASINGTEYSCVYPAQDGSDMGNYTTFSTRELLDNKNAAGQFFFYFPLDTKEFMLCWKESGIEQRIALHV